ncbi:MAG TPA: hypothetical protein VGU71_03225 [Candidatus Dormibacteraeota bacterium]|nr:hypothetical protein [Candidatus Dormibacteraeota bacterium]
MIETGHRLNDESYLKWFGWALLTLGRDLDAGHAAAEAACQAEAAGRPLEEIQSAARKAGDRPQLSSPAQIAMAEWAFWAQSTFGQDQSASVRAARQALAELETTHDLETTTNRMRAILGADSAVGTATSAATGGVSERAILPTEAAAATVGVTETTSMGEPTQPRNVKLPFTAWLAVTVVLIVGVGAVLWAFVISPAMVPKVFPPTIAATVSNTLVSVSVDNFPAGQSVYFFVDGGADQRAMTDSSGHADALLLVDPGNHLIAACRDVAGTDCPAQTWVTR